jgi:Na+/glutamate symporter
MNTVLDYIAHSYRGPFAIALGVGLAVAQLVWILFPGLGQGYDPAVMLLASFGLPMTVTAVAMMIWACRWRARRAAAVSRPAPVRQRRG